ncbi:MAG: hypothetical protein FWE35_13630, partial [Streptosporangiales bacterium]|nr:hypothetical protein [Streptosporangiales bacterium]
MAGTEAGRDAAVGRGAAAADAAPVEVPAPDSGPVPEVTAPVGAAMGDWLAAGDWLGVAGADRVGPPVPGATGTEVPGIPPWVSVIVLSGLEASACQPMTAAAATAIPPPVQ